MEAQKVCKLIDILPDRPVQIMVRTNYPDKIMDDLTEKERQDGMLFGYCAWDGKELHSLDGDCYSAKMEVFRYEWESDGSLTVWNESQWV